MSEIGFYTLSDGRKLAYCEYGDPQGHPVFYAHGSPSSHIEGSIFDETARQYGFRLIATDRPGFGESDFMPDRSFLDYPKDIAELADHLGIDRFGVLGWSGGGAHTVVCAYALPERLTFTIALAGYTNFAELPNAGDMLTTKADRMSVGLSKDHPRLFGLFFDLMSLNVKLLPEAFYRAMVKAGNETDKLVYQEPDFKEMMIADQKEAFRQGAKGATWDAKIHYLDWGFRLKEIPARVHIFQGSEDTMVPPAFAKHLAENIPDSELHWLEGQGHMFPHTHQDMIFSVARAELDQHESRKT